MSPFIATYILWALWSMITPLALINITPTMIEWTLIHINSTPIIFPLLIDQSGTIFSSAVLFISANVMNFSKSYMLSDKTLPRFTLLVLLFVLSMNLLIFIPHLITLLIGWDGLGLVSFLLVIYYQNPKSLGAGMITMLSNRIGDVFLLLAIGWSLNQGHWHASFSWAPSLHNLLALMIMLAAMTKSAQLPFSSWLPAAMAAPTPVSALVHSSTLVTAGVFLLIRFSPSLMSSYIFCPSLLMIASLTMLMAGYTAMGECDMKKIIALSTLSQLGVMMSALGLGSAPLALFHLLTHAMFKALMFICAGTLIHLFHHTQDLRLMGNVSKQMPLTTSCLTIANLALCGSPFLSGFYSKDLIIETALFHPQNLTILFIFILATALTAAYSIRFTINILWSPIQTQPMIYSTDSDMDCSLPMMLLTLKALFLGAILNWSLLTPSIHPSLPTLWKTLPIFLITLATILTWQLQTFKSCFPTPLQTNYPLHSNLTSMWQMAPISSQFMPKPILYSANLSSKLVDHGWMEQMGPQGSFNFLSHISSNLLFLQSLPISYFLLSLFLSAILIMSTLY